MNKQKKKVHCGKLDLEGVCVEKFNRPNQCLHVILYLNYTSLYPTFQKLFQTSFKHHHFPLCCRQSQASSLDLLSAASIYFNPLMNTIQTFSSHACKASPSPGSRPGSSGSSMKGPSLPEPGFIKCDGDSHAKSW